MVPASPLAGTSLRSVISALSRRISQTAARLRGAQVAAADRAMLRREAAASIRPVVRGYLIVVIGYYIVNGLLYSIPGDPGYVAGLSVVTVLAAAALYRYTRGTADMGRLEIACHLTNALLFANTMLDISLEYKAVKLAYFALLMPIFAISGASLRVVLPSAAICAATLCIIAFHHAPDQAVDYIWLAFTGLTIALGMSAVMRATLDRAMRARLTADRHRDQAHALAHFDALTGLPNRRHFFSVLEETLQGADRFDLGLIDLDGFKPVNDVYGHAVGDALLIEAGRRVTAICGPESLVARLGGDEFAAVLRGRVSEERLRALGEEICEALRQPFHLGVVNASISGSVGFIRCGAGTHSAALSSSQLLERADYALYDAKQNQRGAPVIFECRHESDMRDFSRIDQALRAADIETELSVVFQPQVDLIEGRTVGFEALARWNSPCLGAVSPDLFIPAAERSGLISDITVSLLKKALQAAMTWPEAMRISFNLSVRDLHSARAIARICQIVRGSGVAPERIEFEITETAMLKDFDQALEGLSALKALGVRIALDDFGSGYSSFSYIHRLPVDKIKIDRSFVTQLLKSVQARKIIKTIVDLCANLNLDHVIEGVETDEELRLLREVNVRCVQGYLFARPMAAEAVAPYLAREANLASARPPLQRIGA